MWYLEHFSENLSSGNVLLGARSTLLQASCHRTPANIYGRILVMSKKLGPKAVAENRKASHDFHFLEKWEAGIALLGPEVKSVRSGRVNLGDSYVRLSGGEAYVVNMHISPYEKAGDRVLDPTRQRKLLLNESEIKQLIGGISRKGLTCIPIKVYFKRGYAKLQIALCEGKKTHDKRESLKKRIHQREMDRATKQFRR